MIIAELKYQWTVDHLLRMQRANSLKLQIATLTLYDLLTFTNNFNLWILVRYLCIDPFHWFTVKLTSIYPKYRYNIYPNYKTCTWIIIISTISSQFWFNVRYLHKAILMNCNPTNQHFSILNRTCLFYAYYYYYYYFHYRNILYLLTMHAIKPLQCTS